MQKGILTLSNAVWNEKRRYKVNSVVKFGSSIYQNSTGRNSLPSLLIDWVLIKSDVSGTAQLRETRQTYTSGAQEFTLPEAAAQIILITVNGVSIYDYTVLSDTLVRIDIPLEPTVRVVIHYLVDLNLGIAPYYTQAQVDSIIGALPTVYPTVILTIPEDTLDIHIVVNGNKSSNGLTYRHSYYYELGGYIYMELNLTSNYAVSDYLNPIKFNLPVPSNSDIVLNGEYLGIRNPIIGNGSYVVINGEQGLVTALNGGFNPSELIYNSNIQSNSPALISVSLKYRHGYSPQDYRNIYLT